MRTFAPRRSGAWLVATTMLLVLFWVVDLAVLRAGVPDPLDDTWEYGAAARSLLAGHGFRTPVVHPPLWTLRDAAGTVPVLVHGPLLPVLLAPLVAMTDGGVLDHVAWIAALFAFLTAMQLYALGERTYSSPAGTAAAAAFTLSPLVLHAVHHDIALVLGALALSLALGQLAHKRPHGFRAGLAIGLGMLVRPEFLYTLPVLFLLAGAARRRFLQVALVPLVPWMWHNWVNAGSPLFNLSAYLLLGYWSPRWEISVMRDFALPPHAWPSALWHSLSALPAKWFNFFPHAVKAALYTPSPWTGWLAPVGTLLAVQTPGGQPLALAAPALAVLPIAIMTVTLYDPRYLVPFLPVFALPVARGIAEMVDWMPRWTRRPRVWFGTFLLLLSVSAVPALLQGRRDGYDARVRLAVERAELGALRAPKPGGNAVVFSDTPDFVAWTLRRPALWITRAEYLALPFAADSQAAPADRPARRNGDVTWFHSHDGRGSALLNP